MQVRGRGGGGQFVDLPKIKFPNFNKILYILGQISGHTKNKISKFRMFHIFQGGAKNL